MIRLLPLLLALFATVAHAGPQTEIDKFIADARKKLADQRAAGMKSLVARLTITSHANEDLDGDKYASFEYRWTAPGTQKVTFDKTPEDWRGSIGKVVDGLWRPLTGAHIFDELAKIGEMQLSKPKKGVRTLIGAHAKAGPVKATFDKNKLMTELAFTRHGTKYVYHYAKLGKLWRVDEREVWKKNRRHMTVRLGTPRKVGKYQLPTTVKVTGGDGEVVALTFAYETIDGAKVAAPAKDKDSEKLTLKAFEQGWRGWSATDKQHQMKALAEMDDDKASAAIARRGLVDPDPAVRKSAAEVLGKMKRKNVTMQVVAALRPNSGEAAVYRALCLAIADIGDHRAVKPLSKNWWRDTKAGEEGLRGRIYAIGKIRHTSSIDALMHILYVTEGKSVGKYKGVILSSLRGLTGQNFGEDRRGWRNWWKDAKPNFRFSEKK